MERLPGLLVVIKQGYLFSDARTVSITMRGTWSGATPFLLMVLLMLVQGQEAPLVPDTMLRSELQAIQIRIAAI
ncbi:hypothetical protein F7725_020550 [Dissostichus mawsoni]|uniref:Uncharacterized protein n=1 Tax=Dissostichus mawsoni TaxID=36200 RepID=A0A7J5YDI6_DISMA|nr:hypothetical protein F7725_020550 [Dissostichus mawsoni]